MLVRLAALFGFVSVALGAFGAHALEARLTAEGMEWWHTATLYALPHAAAALAAVSRIAAATSRAAVRCC
jgi:uncharacterized membrane protein YgdD (TMEM256/DUF423 family)